MDLQSYIQLKEAYTNLNAPKVEVTQEEVEAFAYHLVEEEGLDLSDMTWDELTEACIQEGLIDTFKRGAGQIKRAGQKMFGNASQRNSAVSYEKSVNNINDRKAKSGDKSKTTENDVAAETKGRRRADPNYKAGQGVDSGSKPSIKTPVTKTPVTKTPVTKTPPATKSTPAPTPAKQTGNKAADMKSWATANPKLAAAKAKRDASRGTSATSNPMLKDLAKRMPKPAAPKPQAKPTVKPTAPAKPMSRIAAATSNVKSMKEDFDIVLDHLIENGFAAEDALKLMVTMSPEKLEAIIEEETGAEYHDRMKKKTMPWKEPNATKATATPEMKAKLDAKKGEKKPEAKKDTRTDAEKMSDATGPRKGSNYRGD